MEHFYLYRRDPRGSSGGDRSGSGFSMDPRTRDRDLRDRDMRGMSDRDLRGGDPRAEARDRDLRDRDLRDPRMFGSGDPRSGGGGNLPPSTTAPSATPSPLDPRAARRGGAGSSSSSSSASQQDNKSDLAAANNAAMSVFSGMAGLGPGATDKEKANLIMQVLQLSDEQINKLPAEQRQSILTLKEQIAKSTSQGR